MNSVFIRVRFISIVLWGLASCITADVSPGLIVYVRFQLNSSRSPVHIPIAVWPRTNKRFLNRAPDVTSTNSLVSIFVFISLYRITYEAHESRFIFMT